MMPVGKDFRLSERERKIMEKRRELSEQRLERIIEKTKNPPRVSSYLIATLHEKLCLRQMQKYFGIEEERGANLFWENQKRFLEFLDLKNPEKAKPGYKSHAWALHLNSKYASKLKSMSSKELKAYREENWRIYNTLCEVMHELVPKYSSLDKVLIRSKSSN